MSYRFKVFFYARKNYVNKDGEVGVMVRISLDGQRTQFSSKLTVNPELWDAKASFVTGDSITAHLINEKLRDIKSELSFHYKELERQGIYVTVDKVRDAYLGVTASVQMLLIVFSKHNEELKLRIGKDISVSGVEKYERTRTRLGEFMKYQYNLDDIPFKELNYNFIYSFETYLTTVWNCSVNTTAKYLQQLKRIIALAKNNGWIQSDPFTNFKIRFKKVDRGYLNQDELTTIMQKKFAIKRLEQVRDIFVFSCFTGLAYVDVRNLNEEDIRKSFDGKLWIMKKRQKTDVLNTSKSIPPKTDTSGKLDIKVPLDYKPVADLIEEQEELEKLGLPSESSSDLTFEEMMQVVNEVENEKSQYASKTGKLLYENENTDWVEQLASSSGKYQKRITDLIDLHLGRLVQPDTKTKYDDGLKGFDIGEYVR